VRWRALVIAVVLSVLPLLTTGCALAKVIKEEATDKIEEVAQEKAEEAEAESEQEAPTKKPTSKKAEAAEPTATEAEEEEPERVALGSVIELDSYRQVVTASGTRGDEEWQTEMLTEVVREPPAQRYVVTSFDESEGEMAIEIIQIGDVTYMRGPDGNWMSMTSSDPTDMAEMDILEPDEAFNTDECDYKGKEKVNGLETKHYVCDTKALLSMPTQAGTGSIEKGTAEYWVSTKYNVAVKVILDMVGKDEDGVELGIQWQVEVTDINEPIEIEAPEGVEEAGLPDDIPMIDGAYEMSAMTGIVNFKVDTPVAEVAEFYQSAMDRNGWTFDEDGSMGDMMLKFDKGERSANLMLAEEGESTTVTIMTEQ